MELPDWQMDSQDGAIAQMRTAFRNLIPLVDNTLRLAPNPAATKGWQGQKATNRITTSQKIGSRP